MFLPCSFWLADNYVLQGRREDAARMFERLLSIRNDVGLLSEEYDPAAKRVAGQFSAGILSGRLGQHGFRSEPQRESA
jgi:GH15 family glucan-1,4-alpha-glucosidase